MGLVVLTQGLRGQLCLRGEPKLSINFPNGPSLLIERSDDALISALRVRAGAPNEGKTSRRIKISKKRARRYPSTRTHPISVRRMPAGINQPCLPGRVSRTRCGTIRAERRAFDLRVYTDVFSADPNRDERQHARIYLEKRVACRNSSRPLVVQLIRTVPKLGSK